MLWTFLRFRWGFGSKMSSTLGDMFSNCKVCRATCTKGFWFCDEPHRRYAAMHPDVPWDEL